MTKRHFQDRSDPKSIIIPHISEINHNKKNEYIHNSLSCDDIAGASSMTLIQINKPIRNNNLNISDIDGTSSILKKYHKINFNTKSLITNDISGAAPLKLTRNIVRNYKLEEKIKKKSNFGRWPLPVQPKWKFGRSERITTLTPEPKLKQI